MKKIFLHIEYLLLEHDCVIIPQLGGFFAQDMPSEWIEEEALFLPPYRTVHFNESLCRGDSLLVDSLAAAYSITPAEAERQVAQFVQQVRMELLEQGSIDFGSIGVMMQEGASRPITFSPCKAGVTTPALYGLDALHIEKLQEPHDPILIDMPDTGTRDMKQESRRQYVLRLNRRLVHAIAAVAAGLILFVLGTTPLANTGHPGPANGKAQLFVPYNLITPAGAPAPKEADATEEQAPEPATRPQPSAAIHAAETAAPAPAAKKAPGAAHPAKQAKADTPTLPAARQAPAARQEAGEPAFAIVLASVTSQAGAEAFAARLQKEGYDAHVYQKDKMVRVIIPCYEGREKAVARMRAIKQIPSLKDAWITPLH